MKKRLLSMVLCIMMVVALVPVDAFATTAVTNVKITSIKHPIQYKEPSSYFGASGTGFTTDSGVVWYEYDVKYPETSDLTNAAYVAAMDSYKMGNTDTFESGKYYVAMVKCEAGDGYNFVKNTTQVDCSDLKRQDGVVKYYYENKDGGFRYLNIYVFYRVDYLYDAYGLNTVQLYVDGVNDDAAVIELNHGDSPWTIDRFSKAFDTKGYNLSTATWHKGTVVSGSTQMRANDKFEAGNQYTLRVKVDSSNNSCTGSFGDGVIFQISNVVAGNTDVHDDFTAWGDFVFEAKGTVDALNITGLPTIKPYDVVTGTKAAIGVEEANVTVTDKVWQRIGKTSDKITYPVAESEKFQPNTTYRMTLDVKAADGFTLNLSDSKIVLKGAPAGTTLKYYLDPNDPGKASIEIEMTTGSHAHNFDGPWQKNADYHWKQCVCGDKVNYAEHTYNAGVVTKAATEIEKGVKTYICTVCAATKTEEISMVIKPQTQPIPPVPAVKGATIKDAKGASYKVTKSDAVNGAVSYKAAKKNAKGTITIPATVTIDGITYKVTAIEAKAFKNNKKITKVVIGKNVTTIGKEAFSGCTQLKTVTMGANVKTINDKAFYKCTALTKITIPVKVTKIGKQALCGCKKLKSITIKTAKLTTKKVGSKAFSGIYKKATIKVPKKQLKAYKKLLVSKGVSKRSKIKK